jgi:hypothetical protein
MHNQPQRPAHDSLEPVRSGLLPAALRRDLADLNAQYLDLGLVAGVEADARFAWSEPVRCCLLATDVGTRASIATVPFALFGLALGPDGPGTPVGRVEDGAVASVSASWQIRFDSFAYQAVFLARRLLDAAPMALELVFGLPADAQRWLAECRLVELAGIAGNPGVIRPRWRLHARFWEMLASAARIGTPDALRWAHCTGMCLLGAADGDAAPAPSRRRPRR